MIIIHCLSTFTIAFSVRYTIIISGFLLNWKLCIPLRCKDCLSTSSKNEALHEKSWVFMNRLYSLYGIQHNKKLMRLPDIILHCLHMLQNIIHKTYSIVLFSHTVMMAWRSGDESMIIFGSKSSKSQLHDMQHFFHWLIDFLLMNIDASTDCIVSDVHWIPLLL